MIVGCHANYLFAVASPGAGGGTGGVFVGPNSGVEPVSLQTLREQAAEVQASRAVYAIAPVGHGGARALAA